MGTRGKVVPIQKASRQILARAAVLIGGAEIPASRLDIGAPMLKRYLEGDEEIPSSVLLRAIDIILKTCGNSRRFGRTHLVRKAESRLGIPTA
jgi:hypothetical protein